jgi:hypothetical protein
MAQLLKVKDRESLNDSGSNPILAESQILELLAPN